MSYEQEIEKIKNYYAERIEKFRENSPSRLSPSHLYLLQRKEEETMKLINRLGMGKFSTKTLLEVGCGNGLWISKWTNLNVPISSIYGIDIMDEYVENSKKLTPFPSHIHLSSVTQLPFEDETFDIVSQSTVFTSLLDPQVRRKGAKEVLRVLKRGGSFFWYDLRYPSPKNPNLRKVDKKELVSLFPHCEIHLTSHTLLPPLVRTLAPISFSLCRLLEKFPFLRSHYLAIIKKI